VQYNVVRSQTGCKHSRGMASESLELKRTGHNDIQAPRPLSGRQWLGLMSFSVMAGIRCDGRTAQPWGCRPE
jgi:hypothetical protein